MSSSWNFEKMDKRARGNVPYLNVANAQSCEKKGVQIRFFDVHAVHALFIIYMRLRVGSALVCLWVNRSKFHPIYCSEIVVIIVYIMIYVRIITLSKWPKDLAFVSIRLLMRRASRND